MSNYRLDDDPLLGKLKPMMKYRLRKYMYTIAIVISIFFLYRWTSVKNDAVDREEKLMQNKKIITPTRVEIYMESQCPDTSRFIKKQLTKAVEVIGWNQNWEVTIVPFGKARCTEQDDDFRCECQHGQAECEINILMNCVIDQVGFPERYIDHIVCMQGKYTYDEAFKCVQAAGNLNTDRINTCAKGKRGRKLLALAGQKTVGLNPALDFVPWVMIDGSRNSDAFYDLTQNVCQAMRNPPTTCTDYLKSVV